MAWFVTVDPKVSALTARTTRVSHMSRSQLNWSAWNATTGNPPTVCAVPRERGRACAGCTAVTARPSRGTPPRLTVSEHEPAYCGSSKLAPKEAACTG
jgi:hypothetical protein